MSCDSGYSVGSSGPASAEDFRLSVSGGLGDPSKFRIFEPLPNLWALASGSCSSVMFLLQTVHTSAAYAPPSACRNVLQRMTRPQQTGTHIVEALSAAMMLLAGRESADYTMETGDFGDSATRLATLAVEHSHHGSVAAARLKLPSPYTAQSRRVLSTRLPQTTSTDRPFPRYSCLRTQIKIAPMNTLSVGRSSRQ